MAEKKLFKENKWRILFFSGIILVLVIGYLFQMERERKFQNSVKTPAVIIHADDFLGRSAGASIRLLDSGKESFVDCDCRDLKKGDTILVAYAKDDIKLVDLLDKYYTAKEDE